MTSKTSVLVTGCGGDIGMGVGRILKDIFPSKKLVGADISDDHPGAFIFDSCVTLPRADSPQYLEALREVVREHKIECIIPIAEGEIRFLQQAALREIDRVPLILANDTALNVGLDKLATNDFLRTHDLPYPWTRVVKDGPPRELPCIIKSRFGRGSRGVFTVDKESVEFLTRTRSEDIWQEFLSSGEDEYTCGVYGCMSKEVRTIIMRRKLGGGLTVSGQVVENESIRLVLEKLATYLELRGSINVQLRLTKRGPMIFEINPRFSSTVVFRHKLGFKDVLWSLEERAGTPASVYTRPKAGTRFYKGYTEYIS